MQDTLEVITGDNGEVRGVKHEVKYNNLPIRQFARMVKEAQKTNPNFLKECRIVGVIPHVLPDGVFTPDKHAMNLNGDELDFLLKKCPDFSTENKTGRSK